MKKAKWIWANTPIRADEYVTFFDEFTYSSGKVKIDISVSGDYAVYLNGELVLFGQYPDYETYKVYDSVEITPFLKQGKNELRILCWYIGADWLTSVKMPRGSIYEVYNESGVLCYSKSGGQCWVNQDYVSGQGKHITSQLGFSYLYDTRFMNGEKEFSFTVEVDGFDNLVLRQNKKTRFGEYVVAKLCDSKKRIYDLGKECCGFLRFNFKATAGEKVRVAFGEHLLDGKVRDIIDNRDFSVSFIGNGEMVDFTGVLRRLGCRYLEVYGPPDLDIAEIGIQEVEYPFEVKPYEIDNQ